MSDGMVKVSDLVTRLDNPTLYMYDARQYVRTSTGGFEWREVPRDEWTQPGESEYASRFESEYASRFLGVYSYGGATPDFTPTHVEVPCTVWGDYVGGTAERANCVWLRDNYGENVITVTGDYGSEWIVLPLDAEVPYTLADDIVALADYPLFDDEVMSEVETQLADEAWDCYLTYDVTRELAARGVDIDSEAFDVNAYRGRFYTLTGEMPEPYYAESAVGVVFPCMSDVLDVLAAEILAAVTR